MNWLKKVEELCQKIKGLNTEEIIGWTWKEFGRRVNFASSFGEEDQIITDMIAKLAPAVAIFTLDTGRLHQETYDLMAQTQKKYPQIN